MFVPSLVLRDVCPLNVYGLGCSNFRTGARRQTDCEQSLFIMIFSSSQILGAAYCQHPESNSHKIDHDDAMADRKARLAALAARAGRANKVSPVEEEGETSGTAAEPTTATVQEETRSLKFRNYVPSDGGIGIDSKTATAVSDNKSGGADDSDGRPPLNKKARTTQEDFDDEQLPSKPKKSALEEALEKAKQETTPELANHPTNNNANINSMGPKKINWDLKRDIQQKLDKVERRTERAIVQLLRERLEKEAQISAQGDADVDLD